MSVKLEMVEEKAALLKADPHPLVGRLGSPHRLLAMTSTRSGWATVGSVSDLELFLGQYRERLLVPLEWPVVLQAARRTAAGQARELIELDGRVGREPLVKEFADASKAVGRSQLRRLRPLKDQRVVQRYLEALDGGRAHGWHTVVYGLVLGVYSFPHRQGLLHYARQTIHGFVATSATGLSLTEAEVGRVLEVAFAGLEAAMEGVLRAELPDPSIKGVVCLPRPVS
jgi:urease accessory protein UreF